jgi:hypothetical protein
LERRRRPADQPPVIHEPRPAIPVGGVMSVIEKIAKAAKKRKKPPVLIPMFHPPKKPSRGR